MKFIIALMLMMLSVFAFGQGENIYGGISYNKYKAKSPNVVTDFAVKGNQEVLMKLEKVHYKYSNNGWHFIRCTSVQLGDLCQNSIVRQIYFTPSFPAALNENEKFDIISFKKTNRCT